MTFFVSTTKDMNCTATSLQNTSMWLPALMLAHKKHVLGEANDKEMQTALDGLALFTSARRKQLKRNCKPSFEKHILFIAAISAFEEAITDQNELASTSTWSKTDVEMGRLSLVKTFLAMKMPESFKSLPKTSIKKNPIVSSLCVSDRTRIVKRIIDHK